MKKPYQIHGGKHTKLYKVWCSMRQRCYNPNNKSYKNYGAKGIEICSQWSDYSAFRDWAHNNGYAEGLTIERKENDGDYCPDNCKWATYKEQNNNQRNTLRLEVNGEIKTLHQLADEIGIHPTTLYYRIYKRGWSLDRAINEKVNTYMTQNRNFMFRFAKPDFALSRSAQPEQHSEKRD